MPSSIFSSEGGARAPRVPWGLVFGLVFFTLAERQLWRSGPFLETVARYTPPGPDGDPLRTAAALRRLSREPAPIVFLGSSQVREGVACPEVEAEMAGPRCVNLAVSAGSPLDMLAVMNQLGGGEGPRITVLGIFPKVLQMAPKSGFTSFSTLLCLLQGGAWAHMRVEEWKDLGFGFLEQLSPTLRFKDGLERAWRSTDGDWRRALRRELPPQPDRLLAGAAPRPPAYFASLMGLQDDEEFARAPVFEQAQEMALRTVAEQELRRGNRMIVVDFPTREGYGTTVPPAALRAYEAACQRIRRMPGLAFIDQSRLGPLEASDFQDFTHLSESGRAKVSRRLAALIRDQAGSVE